MPIGAPLQPDIFESPDEEGRPCFSGRERPRQRVRTIVSPIILRQRLHPLLIPLDDVVAQGAIAKSAQRYHR
jgi:hypothetical protein